MCACDWHRDNATARCRFARTVFTANYAMSSGGALCARSGRVALAEQTLIDANEASQHAQNIDVHAQARVVYALPAPTGCWIRAWSHLPKWLVNS